MRSSAARPSQAAAAASIGADPGPAYIRPELISGGNAPKSIGISLSSTGYGPGALLGRHLVRRRLVNGRRGLLVRRQRVLVHGQRLLVPRRGGVLVHGQRLLVPRRGGVL